jgi:double-strand break repair protein MRE11
MNLKIGILSDTHLGASSIDPELRMDSFEAFEEALKTLVGAGADLILHSGDFYNQTDPQPWVHDKATTILRSTITGRRPNLEVLEGKVNFEAEDVSIGVPVFLIHGTHDRPIGRPAPAPPFQHLVSAGYVNYLDVDPDNKFASKYVVIKKDGIRVLLTGVGHRPEGYINESISKYGVPHKAGYINISCIHNAIEGTVPASEYVDLNLFQNIDYLMMGHAHKAHLGGKGHLQAEKRGALKTKIFVPGATNATSVSPQEEGKKYVHLMEISSENHAVFKSFDLKKARQVFHRRIICENLTAEQTRNKILDALNGLPLDGLEKKPRVKFYLTGKLASGINRAELDLEGFASNYKDKVQNWSEMIIPSDLYTQEELERLERLRGAVEADEVLSAPLDRFCKKLHQLGFSGKHFSSEELYQIFSEIKSPSAARKRVLEKLNGVLEVGPN